MLFSIILKYLKINLNYFFKKHNLKYQLYKKITNNQ
jgi:hypothetical protein